MLLYIIQKNKLSINQSLSDCLKATRILYLFHFPSKRNFQMSYEWIKQFAYENDVDILSFHLENSQ